MRKAFADADAALPAPESASHTAAGRIDVEPLRQKGCLDLGPLLSADQAGDIVRHLAARPLLLGRAPQRPDGEVAALEAVPRDRNYACYRPLDLWQSPHLLELATQDRLIDLAQAYLGCAPTLCSLNAFWALPDRPAEPQREAFHRDFEDFRSLAIFVLLTPVEAATEGGHHYVEGSHDLALLEAALRADGIGTKMEYLIAGTFVGPMGPAAVPSQRAALPWAGGRGVRHRSLRPAPRRRAAAATAAAARASLRDVLQRAAVRHAPQPRDRAARPDAAAPCRRIAKQASRILQRIPATPRHQFVFRHMIRALA